ncbi:MAG: hypothetical protein KHX55_02365 [Proteobacteria bacterium]|nr:hypothetical protein [Pseudomonadota bacterium]
MIDLLLDNIFGACFGVVITSVAFWLTAQKRFTQIEHRLDELTERINNIEDKYQKGYSPEHICESCYEGRYTYIDRVGQCGEKWICENCKEAPAPSWHNQRKKHSMPPR